MGLSQEGSQFRGERSMPIWCLMPIFTRDPREKFVKAVLGTLRSIGYDDVAYDENLFAIRVAGDRTLMLGNIYGHYQTLSGPDAENYLTGALVGLVQEAEMPRSFDEARTRLHPGVRDRTFVESARLMAEMSSEPFTPIPYRPLGSTIVATLLIDAPTSIMTVNEENLRDWTTGFDEAMAAAVANLLPKSTDATWGRVIDGVYASMWNDDYDASRLLLDAVVDELVRDLGIEGDPVAFVPHRNLLILTGSEDVNGLNTAMQLAEENLDHPGQISARPIVRRKGSWDDFEVAADHPVAAGIDRLKQADLALAHGAVVPLIQQLVGEDLYVASCILTEKDGVIYTTTAWSEGAPALIPKTDRILFYRSEEESWMVEWEAAEQVVGDLFQPTDYYPARLRVGSFPTADQFAAMPQIEDWQQN